VPVVDSSQTIAVNVPAAVSADGLPAIPAEEMALTELVRFVQPGVVRLEIETEFGASLGSGFVVTRRTRAFP
jgi:hypothetical protein